MKRKKMSTVNAVICPKCKCKIYSRTIHDAHTCRCGLIFVDGGMDYLRFGFAKNDKKYDVKTINHKKIKIKATKEELHEDWNLSMNNYGVIE